jgi:hypothetical protein
VLQVCPPKLISLVQLVVYAWDIFLASTYKSSFLSFASLYHSTSSLPGSCNEFSRSLEKATYNLEWSGFFCDDLEWSVTKLVEAFFYWVQLDAHSPHTPYSHHMHTHVCASVHMQRRDWEASPPVHGKRAVPPNAYVYPENSGKISEKGAITKVRVASYWTALPLHHRPIRSWQRLG